MTTPSRRRVTAKTNPKTPESAVGEDTTSLLLKMLEQVRQDMQVMQASMQARDEASSQGRARLYERIDAVANDVGTIKGDIRILGEVDGQVRGEVQALAKTVEANHAATQPTVDAWSDLMKTGRRASWVFSIAGITTIGGFVAAVTGVFDWIGGWLRARGWM